MRPRHGARKVIRKALLILSIVGLALSITLLGLSYLRISYVSDSLHVMLARGGVEYSATTGDSWYGSWGKGLYCKGYDGLATTFDLLSSKTYSGTRLDDWSVHVPLVPVVFMLAVSTMILAWPDIRQYRRNRRGQCVYCGYDLRGSTDQCPECGQTRETAT